MLDELDAQARELYEAGEFSHALADFSVLREIRSRREGPYSVKYLAALHDCVRCMSHLRLWTDSDLLCSELHAKYVRTHGRGQADTVDVARHWALAMHHLDQGHGTASLCVTTADAMWDADRAGALLLLAAAAAEPVDASALAGTGLIDGVALRHTADLVAALDGWRRELARGGSGASIAATGLAAPPS